MIIDSHTHLGQFFDLYFNAKQLSSFMERVGIGKYVVSSTTTCENNYHKILDEFHQIVEIDAPKVIPMLWITSKMLEDNMEAFFLDSDIKWKALKIHPGLEDNFWDLETAVMDYIVEIAMDFNFPILIHTGYEEGASAANFKDVIRRHEKQKFILAHGRPLNETVNILKRFNHAFVDTAFMPINDILKLINDGLEDRILWGSDYCIIKKFYPQMDLFKCYSNKLKNLQAKIPSIIYEKITFHNFMKVYGDLSLH